MRGPGIRESGNSSLCHPVPNSRDGNQEKRMKDYYVYILASKKNGTLYVGVTNNLLRRIYEHRNDMIEGFTKKYKVHRLVYHAHFESIESAINWEKKLKRWRRKWKLELIEKENPQWEDLYDTLVV
jgi:putative endonuclease